MGVIKQAAQADGRLKSASLEAVVIRADGTREELGTIAYWHRNPIRRALWRLRHRPVVA